MIFYIFVYLFSGVVLSLQILSVYTHDDNCYTQGLTFVNQSTLLQSCGHYSQSRIRHLFFNEMLCEFQQEQDVHLPKQVFGEGVVLFKNKVYVLTWKQNRVLVLDKELKNRRELFWNGEGWGITHNNTHMFISDGSSTIYVVNQNLTILQHINVEFNNQPLWNLNQLQFYEGNILANIYYQPVIAQIDILSGKAKLHNLKSIITQEQNENPKAQVLNGIAYNYEKQKLIITGKYWRFMYQIQL